MQLKQVGRLRDVVSIGVIGALMLIAFALVGGTGGLRVASAAPATSITSISVSPTCGTSGGFTGSVNLDGTFTGTVTLGLYYHLPGGAQFVFSGITTTATFTGGTSATYNFGAFSFPGANSYRIQVIDAAGLGGASTKSASVPPCTGTTTTTTTTTSTSTSTTTSTTTTGTTTATTTATT